MISKNKIIMGIVISILEVALNTFDQVSVYDFEGGKTDRDFFHSARNSILSSKNQLIQMLNYL